MNSDFSSHFLDAVRQGDGDAAAEVVRRYEPYLRQVVRLRLADGPLRRAFDSTDVCQSVFAAFFARLAAGEFHLSSPERLRALLACMAVNKVVDKARGEKHHGGGLPDDFDPPARGETPGAAAERRDLLDAFRRRLNDDERRVFDGLARGLGWTEIAAETGKSPDAVRMMLTRAAERFLKEVRDVR